MLAVYSEVIRKNAEHGVDVRCVIVSETTPESLTVTGAAVENLGDNDVVLAGSLLITPTTNYIAFSDGVFAEKE